MLPLPTLLHPVFNDLEQLISHKQVFMFVQIEDKAIEELLEHYGGRYNPCEYIVVERQTRKTDSPDWVK